MAETFTFELVSPERILLSADNAEQVVVPGADGQFAVLAGHSPVISTLRPGILDVVLTTSHRRILVQGGFAEVEPDRLTVLAQHAYDLSELSPKQITSLLETAEAELDGARDDETRRFAHAAVEQLKALQAKAG